MMPKIESSTQSKKIGKPFSNILQITDRKKGFFDDRLKYGKG